LTQPHHVWFQEIKGTVFIPQDCTPPIGIWDASSSVCTLTQNLNENVEIRMNNFTLDCNGHLIKGRNTGYGINLESKTNVVVKNCNLSDFSYGFYLWGSNDNILLNNTSILNNASGISLYFSNGNSLINNFVLDNQRGVCIEYSHGNILKNNIMSNNRYNFKLYGEKIFILITILTLRTL
ncbi:MAG: NosD domain-containing protein, partial [candidate division WOR-3 bacterium]